MELKDIVKSASDKKSIILILDCCYSGLATKGDPKADFEKNLDPVVDAEGRIILASTEADAVSREISDYTHNNKQPPHAHGIFTSYLIDGLDGEAADKDGIISIDGLRKYVENKMTDVKKQKPRYSVLEGSKTDHIKIGLVPDTYKKYIESELIEANKIKDRNQQKTDVIDLYSAAIKVHNLLKHDQNNQNAINLKGEINKILKKYDGPITEWLRNNARSHKTEIDDISDGLYFKLNQLENNLIFDEFITIDSLTLELLDIFCEQISYQSSDIDCVIRRMKISIKNTDATGLL